MEPISPKIRVATIALTLFLALIFPILILELAAPERSDLSFVGVTHNATPTTTQIPTESPRPSTATALGSATAKPSATATLRISASLFEGAYIDGIAVLTGGRSMIRIILQGPIQGQYRMEAGSGILRPYECFIPETYVNRLYCYGPGIPRGASIVVRVYEGDTGTVPVFEATHLVGIFVPSSSPKSLSGGPAPTSTMTAAFALTPTLTSTPTDIPTYTLTPTQSPITNPSPTPTESPIPPTETTSPTDTPHPPTVFPNGDLGARPPAVAVALASLRTTNRLSGARYPSIGPLDRNPHV